MKKNFFKKLSFVLVLAMIVSVLAPASGVFAAAAAKLNKTKVELSLSGISGSNEFDFNVINKPAGATFSYASSKKSVVAVKAKSGVATAKATGSATITVTIKVKGKKNAYLKAAVAVKDNIETVAISNKPDKALAVGQEWDFNRTYTTESGATAGTTSVTRWFVDKADKATITDAGMFKASAAGKFKVTAVAFASKDKYNEWLALKDTTSTTNVLATDSYEVTVAVGMTATQKDLNTAVVKFDSAQTDAEKNISLFQVVGTTEVKVTSVKAITMNADKTEATIDTYVDFTEGATYIVKYPDAEQQSFVAATVKPENVKTVVVNTKEIVLNTPTKIAVSLLNDTGVDIGNGIGDGSLLSRVDFTSTSDKIWYDSTNKQLTGFTKGDQTTVTAVFHNYTAWDQTTGEETSVIKGTGVVTAVDAATLVAGSIKAWTIVNATASPNYSDVKQKLAANDSNKRLFVQLNTTTGTNTGTVDSSSSTEAGNFKFESSDPTVLVVADNGALYPVKAGAVTIVVKYNDKSVDVVNLTVATDRKATIMELSTYATTVSNSVAVDDKSEVTVKVKDQLGEEMTVTGVVSEKLSGSPASAISEDKTSSVVFHGKVGTAAAVEGTYQYKVTATTSNGNTITRNVTVTVVKPSSASASAYNLVISNTNPDSKSVGSTDAGSTSVRPQVTINLFGMAGTKTSVADYVNDTANFRVKVTNPDNTTVTLTANTYDLTTISAPAYVAPVKNGTYKVTAEQYKASVNNWVVVDVDYFTVKNTQTHPVLAEIKDSGYTAGSTLNAIADACFRVSYNGNDDVTTYMDASCYTGDLSSRIFVRSVKFDETITDSTGTYTLVHTVDVNRYLTVK